MSDDKLRLDNVSLKCMVAACLAAGHAREKSPQSLIRAYYQILSALKPLSVYPQDVDAEIARLGATADANPASETSAKNKLLSESSV